MTYEDAIKLGLHRFLWAMPFEEHLARQRLQVLRSAPKDPLEVLSVGCGEGSLECSLSSKFNIYCQDTHSSAKTLHPELNFSLSLPEKKFEYIFAVGGVFSSVPSEEQEDFLEGVFSRLSPGGTLLLDLSYCSFPLMGDVREYCFEGKKTTETYHNLTDHSFDVTTKVSGLGECTLRYYPCDVKAKLAKFAGPFRILH